MYLMKSYEEIHNYNVYIDNTNVLTKISQKMWLFYT